MGKYDKNKGLVIWLTGLPCSGKTTISKEIEKYFKKRKLSVARLDGDIFRKRHNLKFSKKDRDENIRLAAEEAKSISQKGTNVIAAFVSPYKDMRNFVRRSCPNFLEIFLNCGIEECKRRDSKGMYKKALAGEIRDFTGVQDPYEIPEDPDIILDTETKTLKQNTKLLTEYFEKWKLLSLFAISLMVLEEICF